MIKRITVVSEIQMYIFMLEETYKRIYTNYQSLKDDLLKEFEIDVSLSDISKIYEPTQEEDSLDMEFMLRNIGC